MNMTKKKKSNTNNKVFIGLILLLLILSPFLAQKKAMDTTSDQSIRLSNRDVFIWLDIPPKETDQINVTINQSPASQVKTNSIPMYPYENPFFLVMIDSTYTKDPFYKETFLAYLKNKKFELFPYENSWLDGLTQAKKKADLVEDPCIFILIGTPQINEQDLNGGFIRYPLYVWTYDQENKNIELQKKIVRSTGGEIYAISDPLSLEKMDISIHSPLQHQRIQFVATIPFLQQFIPTRLNVRTKNNSYSFQIDPTKAIIEKIKLIYRIIFGCFLLSSFFVLLNLVKKSRKKWKKSKKKKEAKKTFQKYCIAWIEEESKKNPSRRIDKSPFLIGSSSQCNYKIEEDASISAKHCRIVESKCAFIIVDMQSRNGTFINGKMIFQKQLQDKDRIEIGKTILIFHQSALQYTSDEKVL
jgi:hypothetical protein